MDIADNSSQRLVWITFFVVVMHAGLFLGFGLLEPMNAAKPKLPPKVVVKTIRLEPKPPLIRPVPVPEPVPEVIEAPPPAPESVVEEVKIEEIPPSKPDEPVPNEPEPIPQPVEQIQETIKETVKEPEPASPPPKPDVKPTPKTASKPIPKPASKPLKKKPAAKPAPKKPAVKKEPPPKKPPPKAIKKESPKPDPQKVALQKKQNDLLRKAQESVAKIDLKGNKIVAASGSLDQVKLPQHMGELKVDSLTFDEDNRLNVRERGYRDELAHRLKLLLKLPEKGVVKLKLTLERSGKVLKVEVIGAESKKNRQHIEKALPPLQFPPFGDNFEGSSQYTFHINLKSD